MRLEAVLRERRELGHKLLVPYVTGGLPGWLDVVRAAADAGADAIEVGIPFSDPVMYGPTIQRASQQALAAGTTPGAIVADAARLGTDVPLVVMTYCNIVHHAGWSRFAMLLRDSGIDGAIIPDLPLDEIGEWAEAAATNGIETPLLAAPTSPDDRLRAICAASSGFVYGVALMGVTGARERLPEHALEMGRRLKAATDKPVLLGVGIANAAHAAAAVAIADGVIVGSALVARVLAGAGPEGVHAFVSELRGALDAGARAH
jgi:tryptophan synthase alpha chain